MRYGKNVLAGCYAATSLLLTGACWVPTAKLTFNNRVRLERLSLGMPRDKVLQEMDLKRRWMRDPVATGDELRFVTNPHRVEVYQAAGAYWEILFYYTHIRAKDGVITDDELTPIVLRDGLLVGIGWPYWDDIADYIICPVRLAKGCPSR